MGLEHLYERIITVALGALLGVCALLATAKFVRRRARLLSPLVRAHGALFAVMMGAVAVTAIIASVKDPPTNQMRQVVSPRMAPLRMGTSSQITDENIANGYRVAETCESCEIVGREAFGNPQMHMPWLLRGGVSNVFWHAVSPSNSLVVTWENSPVSRDVNGLTNFQAELFAYGNFVCRYDDHTVVYSRVHPLDLDFDGLPNAIDIVPETPLAAPVWNQSEAWAAAAFPSNAAEIASAGGYAAWSTQRAADPNRRLVRFGVASPDGRWPICVEVGGVPVMADGRAELLYALDCGAQVPFSLSDGGLGAVTVSCAPPDFQTLGLLSLILVEYIGMWL